MTMAARVLYGMARQGDLPRIAGHVHSRTGTPLIATGLVMACVIALTSSFPLDRLAEGTSIATLAIFALVNLSLLRIRVRKIHTSAQHVRVPVWVPALGFVTCLAMIGNALLA